MINAVPHFGFAEYWIAAINLGENLWWLTITMLIILDGFTGSIKGLFPRAKIKVSSTRGIRGWIRNGSIWLAVTMLYPITIAWGLADFADFFLTFLIGYYGLSIIENFGVMGMRFPDWMVDRLEKLEDLKQSDSNDGSKDKNENKK